MRVNRRLEVVWWIEVDKKQLTSYRSGGEENQIFRFQRVFIGELGQT